MEYFRFIDGTEFHLNGKKYKIISVFQEELQVQEFTSGRIETLTKSSVLGSFNDGHLVPTVKEYIMGKTKTNAYKIQATFNDLSEQEKIDLKKKLSFVKHYLRQNHKFSYKHIQEQLKIFWDEGEMGPIPSSATAYRWVKKYQLNDENPFSLIPNIHRRGNRDIRLHEAVLDFCRLGIDSIYMDTKKVSIKETYREILAAIGRENQLLLPSKRLTPPSYKKVRGMIHEINKKLVTKAREGPDAANLKFRLSQGSVPSDGLNSRWEIDHTPMDIFVIDDDFGIQLPKKPTLTTVYETETKSVMAALISFETCSTTRVGEAVKQAIMPKSHLKTLHPDYDLEWHCHGIPDFIAYDHGKELTGIGTEAMLDALNIDSAEMPVKRGDKKGGVESTGGNLNHMVTERLSGKSFASIDQKPWGHNPKKDAKYLLSEVREVLFKMIEIYHSTKHNAINMSPKAKWIEKEKKQPVRLPINPEYIDAHIGQMTTRTLSHIGIEFMNLLYNSVELNKYFGIYGKHKVSIRYNSEDLGSVIVMAKNQGYFRVPVNKNWEHYANGLGVTAHKFILEELRLQNIEFTPTQLAMKRSKVISDVEERMKRRTKQKRIFTKDALTRQRDNTLPDSPSRDVSIAKPSLDFDFLDEEEIPTMEEI